MTNKLILNGHEVGLESYLSTAKEYTKMVLNEMRNKIGNAVDIQNIILVGGPASLFQKSIAACFPGRKIHTLSEPIYANVRGFQIIGELLSYQAAGK